MSSGEPPAQGDGPACETASGPPQGPLTLGHAVDAGGAGQGGIRQQVCPSGGSSNSGWGRAVAEKTGAVPAAPGGGPPTSSGGSWTWQPAGMESKGPWRKRHPILFWGGLLVLFALIFGMGRMSEKKMAISGPRIAVVQVEGMILDAEEIVAFMEKVRKDTAFKGAVLRINSPGGAVGPSQEMYAAVKRLSLAKPVVASMSSVAASGGYYVALGANRVIAGPSSLTASIGVKMQVPNIESLMRTIGISETTLTTGGLKDAGSTWRDMKPEEEAYFQALITDMYEEFISTVARERQLAPEQVRAVADGRAMTGRQALEAGLVDELGDFYTAVNKAKELAGIAVTEEVALVKGPEKQNTLLNRLLGLTLLSLREQAGAAEQPVFMY